jgi:hypothetical protein
MKNIPQPNIELDFVSIQGSIPDAYEGGAQSS